jgi:caa(3)-type oxidase subunit IV
MNEEFQTSLEQESDHPAPMANRILIAVWLLLITCTLVSVGFAEGADLSTLAALFVCSIAVFKAQLVIDYLIGLKHAHPRIRKVMLGYVYLILLIIMLGIVFPDWIVRLTSLN